MGSAGLVGHNWGGGHVVNTVMHRPELARSEVADVVAAREGSSQISCPILK